MAKKQVAKTAASPASKAVARLPMRERKRNQYIMDELFHEKGEKGDFVHSREVWNRMHANSPVTLMTMEIHECMEAGKFTHVYPDNSHSIANGGDGCEVIELEGDIKVLLLPTDIQYDEWRVMYDELMNAKSE